MKKRTLLTAPALALGALSLAAAPAMAADDGGSWSGQTTLESMNNSGTSGDAMIEVHHGKATVTVNISGAAKTFQDGPFPHAQHIHIEGEGVCPSPDADKDGDGVVSTVEGKPAYGGIGTSLTTKGDTGADSALAVKRFPGGGSYNYERTFEINDDTAKALADGSAVVVVHGVNPKKLSDEAAEKKSELNPDLPLAATIPAACGELDVSQVGAMPEGGPDTGSPVPPADNSELVLGVGIGAVSVAAIGGGTWALRRRSSRS